MRMSVRWFRRLTGYYRRLIVNFSKSANPLPMLTSPKVSFLWTDQSKKAFGQLKAVLMLVLILEMYDPCHQPNLHTDASTLNLGVVLYI